MAKTIRRRTKRTTRPRSQQRVVGAHELVMGTYRYTTRPDGVTEKLSAFLGTDAWDEAIKRNKYDGVEMQVVLRPNGPDQQQPPGE